MKKVLVFGTFDGIHPGHLNFFEQARRLGESLTVVVARDETVQAVKGRKPLRNELERLRSVTELHVANHVRLGSLGDKYEVVREERPDVIALGYDQSAFVTELPLVAKHAVIVRLEPYFPEQFKSSKINQKSGL